VPEKLFRFYFGEFGLGFHGYPSQRGTSLAAWNKQAAFAEDWHELVKYAWEFLNLIFSLLRTDPRPF
jgi:hypothetical protein